MGTIREAIKSDLADIIEIDNYYINNTTANWSWYPAAGKDSEKWLDKHGWPGRPVLVYEQNNKVLGYGALSDFNEKESYWPVAENSIYINNQQTRKGIGTKLMTELLKRAKTSGLKAVVGYIDSENTAAIQFYNKMGFEYVGEMKNIVDKFEKLMSLVIMIKYL